MQSIIVEQKPNFNHHSSVCSQPTLPKWDDLCSHILNASIRNNIEAFVRQLTHAELELFKYLCYFYRKWKGNIQVSIKNLMARFKLKKRRIQYMLTALNDLSILVTLKKGGGYKNATKRTLSERGLILWKAISQGFYSVKQDIPKNSALSCAPSPGVTTNYISSKVGFTPREVVMDRKEEEKIDQKMAAIPDSLRKELFQRLRESCKNE